MPEPKTSRRRRRLKAALATIVVVAIAFSVTGYRLFTVDHSDRLRHVDAIVVLGGDHDGREFYGLNLARQGYASTVLISDPYHPRNDSDTEVMTAACSTRITGVTVRCFIPDPETTRGEAMYVKTLATQYHWRSLMVISWRYHLVRARYVFGQCFSGELVMRAVPRTYSTLPPVVAFTYAYQFAGLAKAAVLGC
ncbi:YdcF family protein [Gordonia sp. TBRC 11910]|uniref:YdcF family protein n=1 Tax=Gordonia asplenii TaxID=2725283 RepID=A0A848L8N2_9ACTN|nr:YdcF family protein [Gordonia asplenii]NMO03938.1 YdcF family protein [Gordonia asplenii]